MNLDLNSNDSYCLNSKIRRIHTINTLIDDKSRLNGPYLISSKKRSIFKVEYIKYKKKNQNLH